MKERKCCEQSIIFVFFFLSREFPSLDQVANTSTLKINLLHISTYYAHGLLHGRQESDKILYYWLTTIENSEPTESWKKRRETQSLRSLLVVERHYVVEFVNSTRIWVVEAKNSRAILHSITCIVCCIARYFPNRCTCFQRHTTGTWPRPWE